ncbi:MAG TPA: SDR family NAD(P)-dependent oxidoreductase, partial [Nitrospiria bacterium]|nr:SDR family NAD(P)-dependent oxidoreductase [Nitrospiria bacterium]
MTERVAVITGGAKGIGRAIGMALAQDGWSIALCY